LSGNADVVGEAHKLHPEWEPTEIENAVKICNALHEICDKIPNVIKGSDLTND
jgi:hypothetical protein